MARVVRVPPDQRAVFAAGFDQIRDENDVPRTFPPDVLAAAHEAARLPFDRDHVDRTNIEFVTLDPASSTDLDQAFSIEGGGDGDMILRYAIADVAWFVPPGGVLDMEARTRGVTIYLPDGRAPLYPPALSESAVSLLPDGPRPAVVFIVRVDPDGVASLDGAERAVIRSRAKLGYESASANDLPRGFEEFAARIRAGEDRRGASRVDAPEQEVEVDEDGDGSRRYRIVFRRRLSNEEANAAMSLASNLAVADVLLAARTGLFRVMADPDERALRRLRFSARALDVGWPADVDLRVFQRRLDPNNRRHAAFMLEVRRATGGAGYAPYEEGVVPWHAAMAASYSHATAPLRRLADRFVVEAAFAIVNGRPVPDYAQSAFASMPDVMQHAEARASRVERAAIDLAEAILLCGREGDVFDAVVTDTDERGARIQLRRPAVVGRLPRTRVAPGDEVRVRLVSADASKRTVSFDRVS
ncbi:MAG: RNB domain-containing ribonuclease [Ilumatobacteraceae bacterium]